MGNSEVSNTFLCAWKPLLKHAVVPKSMDFGTRCSWACTLFFQDEFFLAVVVCHITLGILRKMRYLPVSVSQEFGAVPLGGTDSSEGAAGRGPVAVGKSVLTIDKRPLVLYHITLPKAQCECPLHRASDFSKVGHL